MANDGHEVTLLTMKDFSISNFGFYKDELSGDVRLLNLGMENLVLALSISYIRL